MSFTFEDKVIWITGASSGIGEELTRQASRQGASIIMTARNAGKLETLKNELEPECSGSLSVLPADLSEESDFHALAEKALSLFGYIDILINNAGISQRASAAETDPETVRRIMNINFLTPAALIHHVLPVMTERNCGNIVNISSLASRVNTPLRSTYSASKAALNAYGESLSIELAATDIQVTTVIAGFISTNISRNAVRGDGTPWARVDDNQKNALSCEKAAEQILKAVTKGKHELKVGLTLRTGFGHFLSRFNPPLLRRMLLKANVT